jgi:hypothetical protein
LVTAGAGGVVVRAHGGTFTHDEHITESMLLRYAQVIRDAGWKVEAGTFGDTIVVTRP